MATSKIEKLSIDELILVQQKINDERAQLREKAVEIQAWIDRRTAEETARVKLASMSDAEKTALLQQLSVGGINSEEKAGIPGA